jgi:hypothetical protein
MQNIWVTPSLQMALCLHGEEAFCFLQSLSQRLKEFGAPNEAGGEGANYSSDDTFQPTPSEIVQRYKFHTRFRQKGETVATYMSKFRATLEQLLYETDSNNKQTSIQDL